jgi:transcriptional regulator with XRE-family HTH domain
MSTLRYQFGRRLRQLRRERDLTQEQLAEAAEISLDMLSNIERGINAPSFETIAKLSEGLKLPPRELFDFSGLDK